MAIATPPVAINIQKQETTVEPCLPLYQLANAQLADALVLTNSVMLGFLTLTWRKWEQRLLW